MVSSCKWRAERGGDVIVNLPNDKTTYIGLFFKNSLLGIIFIIITIMATRHDNKIHQIHIYYIF